MTWLILDTGQNVLQPSFGKGSSSSPSCFYMFFLIAFLEEAFVRYMISLYYALIIQDVSKTALQLLKLIEIYTEGIHNVLNCQNVAKHSEFYLG
jgi:hypothetical protein